MGKTKLSVATLLIVLFIKPIVHAATLAPVSSGAPSPTPAPPKPTYEEQDLSNLKTSTSPAWVSKCVSKSRSSPVVCSMEETLVLANTGRAVTSVAVWIKPDTHEPVMTIRVPFGVYLPAGLTVRIDDSKPQSVPLETCDIQGCAAQMQISSEMLAALKHGKQLSITCQDAAKKDLVLPLVLDSFADAFQKIQ